MKCPQKNTGVDFNWSVLSNIGLYWQTPDFRTKIPSCLFLELKPFYWVTTATFIETPIIFSNAIVLPVTHNLLSICSSWKAEKKN